MLRGLFGRASGRAPGESSRGLPLSSYPLGSESMAHTAAVESLRPPLPRSEPEAARSAAAGISAPITGLLKRIWSMTWREQALSNHLLIPFSHTSRSQNSPWASLRRQYLFILQPPIYSLLSVPPFLLGLQRWVRHPTLLSTSYLVGTSWAMKESIPKQLKYS